MIGKPHEPNWHYEDSARAEGFSFVCGVDEAGRGCLAGPVVAASVILDRQTDWRGVNDSKLLTCRSRKRLFGMILKDSVSWGVGIVDARGVDEINILNATIQAMRDSIASLDVRADYALVDAVKLEGLSIPALAIIGGDRKSFSIAAASIVAKVYRDSLMEKIHRLFPAYNFYCNKGYGTKEHRDALISFGPCSIHRRSFRGVLSDGCEERRA